MRHLSRISWVFLLLFILFPIGANADTRNYQYKNCKSVQAQYSLGVAKDKASAGLYKAKISASIYSKYKKFDFDFDGIICEKEMLQTALLPTTTTSSTLPGMSGGNVPPAGNWEDGYVYDTKDLLLGKGYRLYTCASGTVQGSSRLEVQISGQWTTKAISVNSTPSSFCGAAYPILHSYYWIIDVSGPEAKTSLNIRLAGFLTLNERIRNVVKTPTQITTSVPSVGSPVYIPPAPAASTTTTTSPMPTLSFSEERFKGGSCSLISANFDMSSSFQCPGSSSLTLYGPPQRNFSFPAIFTRQYQGNGTNVRCSWNLASELYFCS